ncbi:MAG: type II toxin-antitoxin system RelE/ParE family toxin [Endomicrobium sp.]|nr:type II toxin-antitoxin system RelE/ParE family toxin [Endomicrobium sp.]
MHEIIFYKDKNGREFLKDYIYDLFKRGETSKIDKINAEKIIVYVKVLEKYGTRAKAPIVKHIDGKLWELRPLKNRIFFFYWQKNIYVLLHHFIKKMKKNTAKRHRKSETQSDRFFKKRELKI